MSHTHSNGPLILTFDLDLDILPIDLHSKIQVHMSTTVLTEQQFRPIGGGGPQGLLLGHPSPAEVIQN